MKTREREQRLIGAIVKAVSALLNQWRTERDAALRELRAALEQQNELRYCGVWKADESYRKGNFVTHKGGLWHCNIAMVAGQQPGEEGGEGPHVWTLAVKSGK